MVQPPRIRASPKALTSVPPTWDLHPPWQFLTFCVLVGHKSCLGKNLSLLRKHLKSL